MKQPSKHAISRGLYKMIDGQWHKLCTGPAHDEPVYLPATAKYFYQRADGTHRDGQFLSRCRLCQNWYRVKYPNGARGRIEISSVIHFYEEAVKRVGRMELARRAGTDYGSISAILEGERQYVRAASFRLVLLELISMRRKNEWADNPLLALAERKRQAAKKRKKLKGRNFELGDQSEYLINVFPVDESKPDPQWWHNTGQGWLPRWGEEMLGDAF